MASYSDTAPRVRKSSPVSAFILPPIHLTLIVAIILSTSCGAQAACREVQLRPYGTLEPGASGSVCFAEKKYGSWPITVKLKGLTPGEYYWLSINAKSPESPENDILGTLMVSGWPLGAYYKNSSGQKEGYWDFKEIQTDSHGSFEATIVLPLPPATYRVKFFVKQNYSKGGDVVFYNDSLTCTVRLLPSIAVTLISVLLLGSILAIVIWWRFYRSRRTGLIPANDIPITPPSVPVSEEVTPGTPPPSDGCPLPAVLPLPDQALLREVENALDIYQENPSPFIFEIDDSKKLICAPQGMTREGIRHALERCAPRESTVLILGETGTGKELFAHAIHKQSQRAGGPFVSVDSPSLTDTLSGSQLFGHVRGAFTGATADSKGKFEQADRGTLFIDELGDLSQDIQPKLLRVLESGEVEKIGAANRLCVNVRIIGATNKDLERGISEGTFRAELYYRLNQLQLHLPPLRKRREDILYLIDEFNADRLEFDEEAKIALVSYDWLGNIRELKNFIDLLATVHIEQATRVTLQDIQDLKPKIIEAYEIYKQSGGQGGISTAIKRIAAQFLTEFRNFDPDQAQAKLREVQDKLKQVFLQRGLLSQEQCDALQGREAGIYSLFEKRLGSEKAKEKLIKIVLDLENEGCEMTSSLGGRQRLIDDLLGLSYRHIGNIRRRRD